MTGHDEDWWDNVITVDREKARTYLHQTIADDLIPVTEEQLDKFIRILSEPSDEQLNQWFDEIGI